MTNSKKDFPLRDFYSDIHPTYDRVNRIFTFGRDVAWRKRAARTCLELLSGSGSAGKDAHGPSVLDICTGTGDFIFELQRQMAAAGKAGTLTGFDFSPEMLDQARQKLQGAQQPGPGYRIRFLEGDVAHMPFDDETFDAAGITFGIRNLVYENSSAGQHLREIHRVLKPKGKLVILESSRPGNSLWRVFNNIYLRLILPYLGGLISGNLRAYRYLARSSRDYYTQDQMCRIMEQSGFSCISRQSLFFGSVMLLTLEKIGGKA